MTASGVPEPRIPPDRARLERFVSALRQAGYDQGSCAKRLGVHPRLGVNFWPALRPRWTPTAGDPLDTLIALFIDGRSIGADAVRAATTRELVDDALEMRVLETQGVNVASPISLFPCYGRYLCTDQAARNTAINQVMWLWGESYMLGGLVKRTPRRRAIDLGTGSGVHAILAADHTTRVTSVDINPRAIAFATFNAALNGLHNIDVVLSDLFERVDGTCDLLLANPPYAPDRAARAGTNFWSGGIDGTEILERIVRAIPTRLDRDGACHLIALYPNPPKTTIQQHFDRWLEGDVGRYEVLDHTWPVPYYEDVLSEEPYRGDKSAWRFGVVSLRHAASGRGWWKVKTPPVFFDNDGRCKIVADHDAA